MPDEYGKLTYDYIEALFENHTFSLNIAHETNLDTLKRNYMAKNYDLFRENLVMLYRTGIVSLAQSSYKRCKDFNNNDMLAQLIDSFPEGFAEKAKKCFAVFTFDGTTDNVKMTSYWITTGTVNDILDKFDYDCFDWQEMSLNESDKFMLTGQLGTSCLH